MEVESAAVEVVRLRRDLEVVRRLSATFFQNTKVDEVVEKALLTALEEVGAEAGSVLLSDTASERLVFRYSVGEKPVPAGTAIPWDKGISGSVFQSGEPRITKNVKTDLQHISAIDQTTGFVTRDMLTFPLKRWEGSPLGVLNILNKREGTFDDHDLGLLTIISAFTAISIEQARLFEEVKKAEVVVLLGDIGHDLKNLLQPVVTGSELLRGEIEELYGDLEESKRTEKEGSRLLCEEALSMIGTTCLRIQDRVKEIADCVKGLSAPPHFASCRVLDVVLSVLQTLQVLGRERGVQLCYEGLEELPILMADERRLYNAFYNLINNAIPEVPKGGSVRVWGRMDSCSPWVVISVSDTGRGMPPEVRDRLFTSQAISTKPRGTGLGTKIVKDVVDAHKGSINVESELGKGTTFHLRLPLDPTKV